MKQKISKIIFGKVSGVIDYNQSKKLYGKYLKAKERNRTKDIVKIRERLKPIIKDAIEGVDKIYKIYTTAAEEISADDELFVYDINTVNSFITELERMKKDLVLWDGDINENDKKI